MATVHIIEASRVIFGWKESCICRQPLPWSNMSQIHPAKREFVRVCLHVDPAIYGNLGRNWINRCLLIATSQGCLIWFKLLFHKLNTSYIQVSQKDCNLKHCKFQRISEVSKYGSSGVLKICITKESKVHVVNRIARCIQPFWAQRYIS